MRWLLAALLLGFATSAHASPYDLGAAITTKCGPPGYRAGASCTLQLPAGDLDIQPTKIGTCDTTSTVRNGLVIRGGGASPFATVPYYSTARTTLRYAGSLGGTMLSICGSRVYLQDLTIEGNKADTVVEWRANNPNSAISHFGGMERVTIMKGNTQVRIRGETFNDQIDFLTFRDVELRDGGTCIDIDSQQSLLNEFDTIDCASHKYGAIVRNGGVSLNNFYVGQYGPEADFIGLYLTKSQGPPYMVRQVVRLTNSHFEIAGKHIVDDSNSYMVASYRDNSFLMMTPSNAVGDRVLLDSTTNGPVIWSGNTVYGPVTGRICHRGPGNLDAVGTAFGAWVTGAKLVWGCK